MIAMLAIGVLVLRCSRQLAIGAVSRTFAVCRGCRSSFGTFIERVQAVQAAALSGFPGRPEIAIALGVRDLAIGAGLAASRDPRPWLRARLASEVSDTVLLGEGSRRGAFRRGRALPGAAFALACAAVEYALLRQMRGSRANPSRADRTAYGPAATRNRTSEGTSSSSVSTPHTCVRSA
jgi:hypothetical protein